MIHYCLILILRSIIGFPDFDPLFKKLVETIRAQKNMSQNVNDILAHYKALLLDPYSNNLNMINKFIQDKLREVATQSRKNPF